MAVANNKLYKELIAYIQSSPVRISAGDVHKNFSHVSRPTINRILKEAIDKALILTKGNGSAITYINADPLLPILQYFDQPKDDRGVRSFKESFLEPHSPKTLLQIIEPELPSDYLNNAIIKDYIEKRDFVQFLIDFSCASSALEGGTYSQLDTTALLQYGEMAEDKSKEDAFLVLNHKNALEYMYSNLSIEKEVMVKVNSLLTDDRGMPLLKNSPHFLSKDKMGVREYDEVNIQTTTYLPPFRPGTKYIEKMLDTIIDNAKNIKNPIEASFYLFSRIPYLQPFCDGNKRTSRAICNIPLMKAGLPPISFTDFSKRDYIVSMLSIYELNDTTYAEHTFSKSYLKSIKRFDYKPAEQYLKESSSRMKM